MNFTKSVFCLIAVALTAGFAHPVRSADPWADAVVAYDQGSNPVPGFTAAASALGSPTRFTSPASPFGGVVTPLNASFGNDETVSIGEGGQLTLQFAEPVLDDPLNPFGVDLIVFGNAFFTGNFFNPDFSFNPAGTVGGVLAEGGVVELSSDGVNYFPAAGQADGLFPTNGYADIAEPFTATPGLVPANFTRPVNPAFNPFGKTFAELISGYEGSGGGLGVDIAASGLSSVSFVRISNPVGSGVTPEIDALADVASIPEPAAIRLFFVAALLLLGKTVCRGRVNHS